ncbi:hypothetical protein HAX54_034989 [Datura stramonium]|uniref:Uncharacterized protein n=1 Tax=Datura stramonium TaxID=4076 RepID=A0ABS8VI28_DATST|nr:hypothetical protein [Datura stramonium]
MRAVSERRRCDDASERMKHVRWIALIIINREQAWASEDLVIISRILELHSKVLVGSGTIMHDSNKLISVDLRPELCILIVLCRGALATLVIEEPKDDRPLLNLFKKSSP